MSLASHLFELRKKHQKLGDQIVSLQRSPGSDFLKITEHKKQKLRLKEEMERLTNQNRMTAVVMTGLTLDQLQDDPLSEVNMHDGKRHTPDESLGAAA